MLKKFRQNINYLGFYNLQKSVILLTINVILWLGWPESHYEFLYYIPAFLLMTSSNIKFVFAALFYSFAVTYYRGNLEWMDLAAIPLAVLITFPVTGVLHSCSHDTVKPRWLNRMLGELMGLIQLSGFPEWKITHVIHHTHTDDLELDPHPPADKGFIEFTLSMRASIINSYLKFFFRFFGKNEKSMRAVQLFAWASKGSNLMKVIFWFLVLGPQLFTTLFLTSIAFKMVQYAWLNYSTHRPGTNGVEIHNYNHGLYRWINHISFGLYYHKNHHLAPHYFDPRNYRADLPAPQAETLEQVA